MSIMDLRDKELWVKFHGIIRRVRPSGTIDRPMVYWRSNTGMATQMATGENMDEAIINVYEKVKDMLYYKISHRIL